MACQVCFKKYPGRIPAAPRDTSLPLLSFDPGGVRQALPRRACPDGSKDNRGRCDCQLQAVSLLTGFFMFVAHLIKSTDRPAPSTQLAAGRRKSYPPPELGRRAGGLCGQLPRSSTRSRCGGRIPHPTAWRP